MNDEDVVLPEQKALRGFLDKGKLIKTIVAYI